MRSFLAYVFLACASAHAGFTTVFCSDDKQTLRLSEHEDGMRFVYTGTNLKHSFLDMLQDATDGEKYEVELRFKKIRNDATEKPTCSASAEQPLLFVCSGIPQADGMVLTRQGDSKSRSMGVSDLFLATGVTDERGFGSEEKDKSVSTFELRFSAAISKTTIRMFLSHPIHFDSAACHTEGVDAP